MALPRAQILAIAAAQKLLIAAILVGLLVQIAGPQVSRSLQLAVPEVGELFRVGSGLAFLSSIVLQIVAVARLSSALKEGAGAIVYTLGQCVPCLGLILLVLINNRATTALKDAGIRVGLMGANAQDLARFRDGDFSDTPDGRCPVCGDQLADDARFCEACGERIRGA
jgi:hypothetical protein